MIYRLLSRLPLWLLYRISDLLFVWLYFLQRYRRRVVSENIARVFPEWARQQRADCAREFYRGLCDMLLESLKGATLSEAEFRRRVILENPQMLVDAVDRAGSAIVLGAHQANWEWLQVSSAMQLKIPIDAVYKPLHDQAFDAFMYKLRSRFGSRPIASANAVKEIAKRRRQRRIIAIVADQTPGKHEEKYWATFLGQDTPFYLGPEVIARFTRYPVLFAAIQRTGRGYYSLRFEALADPPYAKNEHAVLAAYVRAMEAMVRRQPEAWLWSHRKWKYPRAESDPIDGDRNGQVHSGN